MKHPRLPFTIFTAAFLGLSLAACSGSAAAKTDTPEKTVEHIIDLFDEKDYDGLCEVSLLKGEVLDSEHPRHNDCVAHYEVIDREYHLGADKDEAKASVYQKDRKDGPLAFQYSTVGGETNDVQLTEQDGRWYQVLDQRIDKRR